MRGLLLVLVCFVIMTSSAVAETSAISYSQGGDYILLPPVGANGEAALPRTQQTSHTKSAALNLKLGNFTIAN